MGPSSSAWVKGGPESSLFTGTGGDSDSEVKKVKVKEVKEVKEVREVSEADAAESSRMDTSSNDGDGAADPADLRIPADPVDSINPMADLDLSEADISADGSDRMDVDTLASEILHSLHISSASGVQQSGSPGLLADTYEESRMGDVRHVLIQERKKSQARASKNGAGRKDRKDTDLLEVQQAVKGASGSRERVHAAYMKELKRKAHRHQHHHEAPAGKSTRHQQSVIVKSACFF